MKRVEDLIAELRILPPEAPIYILTSYGEKEPEVTYKAIGEAVIH